MAQLAGVPREVVQQAREKLRELEGNSAARAKHESPAHQIGLFETPPPHPLLETIESIDPDNLSPREAHQLLYRLRELL